MAERPEDLVLPSVLQGLPSDGDGDDTSEAGRRELESLAGLEAHIGYCFANRGLLRVALTLPSWANEVHGRRCSWPHNACLEFFGDAVLDLCAAHTIWLRFPHLAEGPLTRLRAAVVSKAALSAAARRLDIGRWLFVGRGDERRGGRDRDGSLADAVEAILGAAFLDAKAAQRDPLGAAQAVFARFLGTVVAELVSDDGTDPKSALQQLVQAEFHRTPRYEAVVDPVAAPESASSVQCWRVVLRSSDGDVLLGEGRGSSAREAQRDAARDALATRRYQSIDRSRLS